MVDYTQGSGRQYHTQLAADDIGKYIILTGDPGRVEQVAACLDDAHFVASNREYTTWTGFIDSEKVSVVSTGIGGPSTAICVEELTLLGAHTFLRIGTCGGIDLPVLGGDLVIASGSIRQEGTTSQYAPIEYPAVPDANVLLAQIEAAKELQLPYHVGVVQSKDSYFGEHDPKSMPVGSELIAKWEAYKKLGVLASEMESSTVFVVGKVRHARTGAMFHVLANQEREAAGLENKQDHDLSGMMQAARLTIQKLIVLDQKTN
jgi:uridine phosphorylase